MMLGLGLLGPMSVHPAAAGDNPFYPEVDPQDPATWPTLKHLADEGDITAIDRLHCLWMLHDDAEFAGRGGDHEYYYLLRTRQFLGLPVPASLEESIMSYFRKAHSDGAAAIERRLSYYDYFHPYRRPPEPKIAEAIAICHQPSLAVFRAIMTDTLAAKDRPDWPAWVPVSAVLQDLHNLRENQPVPSGSLQRYRDTLLSGTSTGPVSADFLIDQLRFQDADANLLTDLIVNEWCSGRPSSAALAVRQMLVGETFVNSAYGPLGLALHEGHCTERDEAVGLRLMQQAMLDFALDDAVETMTKWGVSTPSEPSSTVFIEQVMRRRIELLPKAAGFQHVEKFRANPAYLADLVLWGIQGLLILDKDGRPERSTKRVAAPFIFRSNFQSAAIRKIALMASGDELRSLADWFYDPDRFRILNPADEFVNRVVKSALNDRISQGSRRFYRLGVCLRKIDNAPEVRLGIYEPREFLTPYLLGGPFSISEQVSARNKSQGLHPLDLPSLKRQDEFRITLEQQSRDSAFSMVTSARLPMEKCTRY